MPTTAVSVANNLLHVQAWTARRELWSTVGPCEKLIVAGVCQIIIPALKKLNLVDKWDGCKSVYAPLDDGMGHRQSPGSLLC